MGKRLRRSYSDIFLDTLRILSGADQSPIGNKKLLKALSWEEERYDQIKEQLVQDKVITLGRGKGGSVKFAGAKKANPLNIFISYSHVDEEFKSDLEKHLKPLKRLHLIETWHDRKIEAGDEWNRQISRNLENADIVLLLISIDFINSKYCYDIELKHALERHAQKVAVVIPVILRSCLWKYTDFAAFQALPRDGKAVSTWADRDEAFSNIVEGIRVVAEGRITSKK